MSRAQSPEPRAQSPEPGFQSPINALNARLGTRPPLGGRCHYRRLVTSRERCPTIAEIARGLRTTAVKVYSASVTRARATSHAFATLRRMVSCGGPCTVFGVFRRRLPCQGAERSRCSKRCIWDALGIPSRPEQGCAVKDRVRRAVAATSDTPGLKSSAANVASAEGIIHIAGFQSFPPLVPGCVFAPSDDAPGSGLVTALTRRCQQPEAVLVGHAFSRSEAGNSSEELWCSDRLKPDWHPMSEWRAESEASRGRTCRRILEAFRVSICGICPRIFTRWRKRMRAGSESSLTWRKWSSD